MIDLTKPVVYSWWRIPVAAWVAFFGGEEWPAKDVCGNAGFRPVSRDGGFVYAFCSVIDRTPDKRRWRARGFFALIDAGAEVVSGGGRTDDCWKIPPRFEPHILRALVSSSEEIADDQVAQLSESADVSTPAPRAKPRSVPMSQVTEGHVVVGRRVRPVHVFTGKATR